MFGQNFSRNTCCPILIVTLLLSLGPRVALADSGSAARMLQAEHALLGSVTTTTWQSVDLNSSGLLPDFLSVQEIGGGSSGEIGSVVEPKDDQEDSGTNDLGRKIKAGALSAVLPGAGQFYNGDRKKAYIMAGAEVGIWLAYFVFDKQGDNRMDSAREYAGIYAGTSGTHEDRYWQNVGANMDSDAYNESRLREARALGEAVSGLVGEPDAWQWVNQDRRRGYQKLRADGNSAYDRRDFMILFAVVNRAVSVVEAVMGAGRVQGGLQTEVLGMNVAVNVLPSWRDPGARCVVSRSF